MVSTIFLYMLSAFVALLVAVLPTGSLPSDISVAFRYLTGLLNAYSYVVPVATLLQAAVVILIFDGSLLLWHFINWVIRKIPGMQ